ncbi:MAG: hypothetical protein LBL67_02140 [Coriobacteriales bacterium]|jgi:predicted transcriptional regulator of viral defense system|nr:hypothetical protein [Coriobacteriales bacterium]
MKFHEYISTHHVFTTEDAKKATPSASSTESLLKRAVGAKKIDRVRRGLYVSKTGKHLDANADPFEIISTLASDAVLSYHAALVAHGVAHNIFSEYCFRTTSVFTPFQYRGVRYRPLPLNKRVRTQTVRGKAFGAAVVTTREQTIVDCLSRPSLCGGIEEVLRSLSTFPYIDFAELHAVSKTASTSAKTRIGWLLEAKQDVWRVDKQTLDTYHSALHSGRVQLDPGTKDKKYRAAAWQLYLPVDEEEVRSWLI